MKLLSPIRIGGLDIKNRVVSTAHGAYQEFWQPEGSGDRYIAYQERRAEGGVGLIILTAMHVHRTSQLPGRYVYEPEDVARKYQALSARVRPHGTRLVQQLFHVGAQGKSDSHDDLDPIWSFSGTTTLEGEPTHEMTDEEIEEIIDAFASAATVCTANGLDGVELHGTHGYLIQQSFSPFANRRTDKWGEPLRFAKTVAERVRAAIGKDKIMGLRISADDFVSQQDGGVGHEKLCDFAAELIATGLFDYLNHSEGLGGAHYARAIGNYRHKFGEFLPYTRNLRRAISAAVPVIGVGKIPTADLAEQALEAQDCDLVGMTRAQIADPDLIRKLSTGQANRVRLCTGSNQGCFDRGTSITCFQNPEVGEERRFRLLNEHRPASKRVLIVGGGPAGMKAAEIAARRGHKATLVEAEPRLGGRLNLVETMGDAANLLTAINWIEQELRYLNVDIRLQQSVDPDFVRDFSPEAIILATGAASTRDLMAPTDETIPVLSGDEAALGVMDGTRIDLKGTRALFVDIRANNETALVIEALARRGAQVTVATPHMRFGANLGLSHLVDYLRILPSLGVEMLTSTKLTRVEDGVAHLLDTIRRHETTHVFDFIVAGSSPKPNDHLLSACAKLAPTKTAGDMVAPRSAMEAFREGDRCGRTM